MWSASSLRDWPWPVVEVRASRARPARLAPQQSSSCGTGSPANRRPHLLEKAKADFTKRHPDVTVEFVAQPFDQYYTLLGTAIQSARVPTSCCSTVAGRSVTGWTRSCPWTTTWRGQERLAGWDAFSKDGKTYAAAGDAAGPPDLLQQGDLPRRPISTRRTRPPRGTSSSPTAPPSPRPAPRASRSATRKASASSSSVRPRLRHPHAAEYDDWIAGKRDWNSPHVKRIFEPGRTPTTRG